VAKTNRGKSYTQEQKYDLNQFVKFLPGERTKSDVFRGKHFNIVVICLDDGYEITPHYEPYDVFFHVISGNSVFNAGEKKWGAESGSMSLCVLR
jgi:quercetin dioxygenase-like cupin family protein